MGKLESGVDGTRSPRPKTALGPFALGRAVLAALLLCGTGCERAELGAGMIEARLLDMTGASLADQTLTVCIGASGLDSQRIPPQHSSVRTDARGRVTFRAPSSMAGLTLQMSLTLEGDPQRRCWLGSATTTAAQAPLQLGELTLRPARTPTPSESVRNVHNLDDDHLERLLLECFDRHTGKRRGSACPLGALLLEASRRGGERWIGFLEARRSEMRASSSLPADFGGTWITLLTALRLAQGRPIVAKVVVHPDDCDGTPRASFEDVRFEVINLDSEERIELMDWVQIGRFEVSDAQGRPARRAQPIHRTWNVPVRMIDLPPGATSRQVEGHWWRADLKDDYILGEGDWTVTLLYSPIGEFDPVDGTTDSPVFESEPFVVRIRKTK